VHTRPEVGVGSGKMGDVWGDISFHLNIWNLGMNLVTIGHLYKHIIQTSSIYKGLPDYFQKHVIAGEYWGKKFIHKLTW